MAPMTEAVQAFDGRRAGGGSLLTRPFDSMLTETVLNRGTYLTAMGRKRLR